MNLRGCENPTAAKRQSPRLKSFLRHPIPLNFKEDTLDYRGRNIKISGRFLNRGILGSLGSLEHPKPSARESRSQANSISCTFPTIGGRTPTSAWASSTMLLGGLRLNAAPGFGVAG